MISSVRIRIKTLALASLVAATAVSFVYLFLKPENQSVKELELSALAPASLVAVHNVVEAKLLSNGERYVLSLFDLLRYKDLLAPDLVPEEAYIASMLHMAQAVAGLSSPKVMAYLEDADKRLAKHPLYAIAKISAESEGIFQGLYMGLQSYGFSVKRKDEKNALSLWLPKPFEKEGGMSVSSNAVAKVLQGVREIEAHFNKIVVRDRLFRNILVARFVWNATQLSWFLPADLSDETRVELLRTLNQVAAKLSEPDKSVLGLVLSERLSAQLGGFVPAVSASKRISLMKQLQTEFKALCQPRQSAVLPDFILQTHRLAQSSRIPLPDMTFVFNECFVGSRRLFPVQRFDIDDHEVPVTLMLPRFSPGHISLSASLPILLKASRQKRSDLSFTAFLEASGIVDRDLGFNKVYEERLCAKGTSQSSVCLQLAWQRARLEDRERSFSSVAKRFNSAREDLAIQIIAEKVRAKKPIQEAELKRVSEEHSEFNTLDWYMRNFEFIR